MDSFELNKIIGAVLLVALLVIGIGKISNLVFKVNKPEKSNYKVELDVETASETKGDEEPVQREILKLYWQKVIWLTVKKFLKNVQHVIQ